MPTPHLVGRATTAGVVPCAAARRAITRTRDGIHARNHAGFGGMSGAHRHPTMHAQPDRKSHRLLEKLIREVTRAEIQANEHAAREGRLLGEAPPVLALRAVSEHANAHRSRFFGMIHAHGIVVQRSMFSATLATLRNMVVDRVTDAEHAFRSALLDLRHGLDVVKLLREVAKREELFGLIRWCDDWLGARRTLVASVEAQLAWFEERDEVEVSRDTSLGIVPIDDADLRDDFEVISSAGDPEQ